MRLFGTGFAVMVTSSTVESSRDSEDKDDMSVALLKSELVPRVLVEAIMVFSALLVGKSTLGSSSMAGSSGMVGVLDRGSNLGDVLGRAGYFVKALST